jgi:hypothetical protein
MQLTPKNLNTFISILITIAFGVMVCLSYIMAYGKLMGFVILSAISFVVCILIKKNYTIPAGN